MRIRNLLEPLKKLKTLQNGHKTWEIKGWFWHVHANILEKEMLF